MSAAGETLAVVCRMAAVGEAAAVGCRMSTAGVAGEHTPGDAGVLSASGFPVAGMVNGVDVIGCSKSCKKSYVCREGVGDV